MANKNLGKWLIAFGITLLLYWGANTHFRTRSLTLPAKESEVTQSIVSRPARVSIDGLFDLEVVSAAVQNGRWSVDDTRATYLPVSAAPGEIGNMIVYGHNKADVMGHLLRVKPKDLVRVVTENGEEFEYIVDEILTVGPDRVDLLAPTDYEILTLYTCTGFLDSQRFVVRATPLTGFVE